MPATATATSIGTRVPSGPGYQPRSAHSTVSRAISRSLALTAPIMAGGGAAARADKRFAREAGRAGPGGGHYVRD
ncbi:hypothetical protein Sya03_38550 [Spirilliplanes yamanashiensis]|uniref:Uncharacterized protein n=1 Tax=Spirilliplanes yamanashiensis TaxID=42233 RepID=A0A8J3Y9Q3_9ACTN|nr:hypothetical protein Sya03_38550 [Spirilliplanes yamanashiensis]